MPTARLGTGLLTLAGRTRELGEVRATRRVGSLAFLLMFAACPTRDTRPPRPAVKAVLFFSADLHGYLGPCGCSENMRGGISRAAGQLAKAREAGDPVFYLDAGDCLFGALSIPEGAVPQQERKAGALADAMKAMRLSVRSPGPMDDARGPAFRAALALPELATGKVHWLEVEGTRLAVVSAADVKTANPVAAGARREGAAFVVALVGQSLDAALREVADAPGVDLVLAARPRDELAAEENKLVGGGVKVAQVQSKGRSLLRVDLTLREGARMEWVRGSAERERELSLLDQRVEQLRADVNAPGLGVELKALKQAKLVELLARRQGVVEAPLPAAGDRSTATVRFVPLEQGLPQDPAVQAIEAAYDRDVGLLNLAWAKEHGQVCSPADLNRSGFVGSEACVGCHQDAARVWKATKHVRAYESLEQKGKQYHLDCITCHVTGWQQPGGVCRIDDVEGRGEVGCESCHGPGWLHTQMPESRYVVLGRDSKSCTGCHDRENSPHFEFEAYLKAIVGPGHGVPLPDGGTGRGTTTRVP